MSNKFGKILKRKYRNHSELIVSIEIMVKHEGWLVVYYENLLFNRQQKCIETDQFSVGMIHLKWS